MQKFFVTGTAVACLVLFAATFYAACGDQTAATTIQTCRRKAAYSTRAELDAHHIITLEDWLAQKQIDLTPDQESQLNTQHNLVGEFTLDRPIKHPDGTVEMPANWLRPLPEGHPWQTTPTTDDPTFGAWFEVRIVNPLLFDAPDNWFHEDWATAYLNVVSNEDMLTSLIGADTGCP